MFFTIRLQFTTNTFLVQPVRRSFQLGGRFKTASDGQFLKCMARCRIGRIKSVTLSTSKTFSRLMLSGGTPDFVRFFCRLTPESPMERSNYFLETKEPGEDLGDTLFRPMALNEDQPGLSIDNILLRQERQTFRRLPRTGALIFSVKTTLNTFDELPVEQLQALATEIRSWPEDMAKYKGRDIWGQLVLDYCIQRSIVPA